jgi:prepilin-type N-terminal cleavage/methylation domain-containing protein
MSKSVADRSTNCRGFTLIELLLVMLISSVVVLGINGVYRQTRLVWSHIEDRRPIYHNARLITETLRQELSCVYFPPEPDGNDRADGDKPFEPISVKGSELAFYTLAPSWKVSSAASYIAKVRYTFAKDQNADESVLRRFEQPCAGERTIGKESSDVILKGLSDFNVSFVGDVDKDDTERKDALPRALKVSLQWPAPGEGFQTTILIPCQESLVP